MVIMTGESELAKTLPNLFVASPSNKLSLVNWAKITMVPMVVESDQEACFFDQLQLFMLATVIQSQFIICSPVFIM